MKSAIEVIANVQMVRGFFISFLLLLLESIECSLT